MRRLGPAMVCAMLLVSSCAGGGGPKGEPTSPSTSQTASGSPTESASEPSSEATGLPSGLPQTVPPADGRVLKLPGVSIRIPRDWKASKMSAGAGAFIFNAFDADGTDSIGFDSSPGFGQLPLRQQAVISRRNGGYGLQPDIMPATELKGVPVYHISGPTNFAIYVEEFGTIHRGRIISIHFEFHRSQSKAHRDRLVASVLATWQWGE